MKTILWITLFYLVAMGGAATLRSEPAPPEVRIVTDPKIEKRVQELEAKVKKLEPQVKNLEDYFQRRGSRY